MNGFLPHSSATKSVKYMSSTRQKEDEAELIIVYIIMASCIGSEFPSELAMAILIWVGVSRR